MCVARKRSDDYRTFEKLIEVRGVFLLGPRIVQVVAMADVREVKSCKRVKMYCQQILIFEVR